MDQYSQWDNLPSSGNYSPNDPNWGKPPTASISAEDLRALIWPIVQDLLDERLKNFQCDHHCPCSMRIGS